MALNFGNQLFGIENAQDELFRGSMDKGVFSYYVGGDYIMSNIGNSTTETVLLNYTIPANTVINGIKVRAIVSHDCDVTSLDVGIFRIRAGLYGSTTTRTYALLTAVCDFDTVFSAQFPTQEFYVVIDDLDWTKENVVYVTGVNQVANVNTQCYGYQLIIEGY
jgi:hypothetical protein